MTGGTVLVVSGLGGAMEAVTPSSLEALDPAEVVVDCTDCVERFRRALPC